MILACPKCSTENQLPDVPAYDQLYRCRWCAEPFSNLPNTPDEPSGEEIMASLPQFAVGGAVQGKSRTQVAREMETHGVPREVAGALADQVFECKKGSKDERAGNRLGAVY